MSSLIEFLRSATVLSPSWFRQGHVSAECTEDEEWGGRAIQIHIYIYIYVYVYIYTYVYIDVSACAYTFLERTYVYIYIYNIYMQSQKGNIKPAFKGKYKDNSFA